MNLFSDAGLKAALQPRPAFPLGCLPWPAYPHDPQTVLRLGAFTAEGGIPHLAGHFSVGNEQAAADCRTVNGEVYKDSCVELFFAVPHKDLYYNLEINSLGTPHMALGAGRHNRDFIDPDYIKQYLYVYPVITDTFKWELGFILDAGLFGRYPQPFEKAGGGGYTLKGNAYKCGEETGNTHYAAMFPINTPGPDFHRPEFFQPIRISEISP